MNSPEDRLALTDSVRPLYFAYGANMSREDMARRCPDAEALGAARLDGYRFLINADGFATVVPDPGTRVHGVLWRISERDLKDLDEFEDLAGGLYIRTTLAVVLADEPLDCLIYLATRAGEGRPGPGYHRRILESCRAWGFPQDYVTEIAAWLPESSGSAQNPVAAGTGASPMDNTVLIRSVVVRGLVQGVGYRAWVQQEALALDLGGWVRNRSDGAVEMVLAGPASVVTAMIEACRSGPRGARVVSLDQYEASESAFAQSGSTTGFAVLPTL